MPIVQQGALNTTALVVPDLYVQIVPPQTLLLNGIPTNIAGVVGTATWGPVGIPVIVGDMRQYAANFGAVMARKYDMGTIVAVAVQQGAQNFRCVRVTDGTDAAASLVFAGASGNGFTVTAKYTGTLGNTVTASLAAGSAAGSWKLTVGAPGFKPEVFDNVTGSGAAFWTNLAATINNGMSNGLQGPSLFIVASVNGGYSSAPTATAATSLTGGTDGVTTITAATLVGSDTLPRKGMYALRGMGCSIGVLADADDNTQWATQSGFGLAEGIYMMLVAPAGSAIQNGTTGTLDLKASAGLDSYAAKLLHGDWLWWSDQVNGIVRLVSPQGFAAGRLSNLSPQNSALNKPLYGVIGSQKQGQVGSPQVNAYTSADLTALFGGGVDVICNPQPGGNFWGLRAGHNSSSNAAVSGDNYTRMTNYIAATLAGAMGIYVGEPVTQDLLDRIRASQINFLLGMLDQGMLSRIIQPGAPGSPTSSALPFNVVCDASNNPPERTGLGYVQSDAQVRYTAINEKFIVNLQGGQTVQVTRPGAA